MASSSRPRRDVKEPSRFSSWEEGDAAMGNERKRKCLEKGVKTSRKNILEKKKVYMRGYREEKDDQEGGEEEGEVEDDMDDEEVEEERSNSGDLVENEKKWKIRRKR